MYQTREYQDRAHKAVFDEFDEFGRRSTLVTMATGTGKTTVAGRVATTVAREYKMPVLFLAHREVLVRQAAATFENMGLRTGIEMGQEDGRIAGMPDIVCGTVQTLAGDRLSSWGRGDFGLIISDEAHHGHAAGHQAIYRHFAGARHLGITATPDAIKCEMSDIFESLAYQYTMRQAVLDGWLVKPSLKRCMVPIDLKGLKATQGDFNVGELGQRISASVEYMASAIDQRIGRKKTVVFTPDVASAQSLSAALCGLPGRASVSRAKHISGAGGRFGMSKWEQRSILQQFRDCQFQVIVCCEMLIEGWDQPDVECVVIARPTLQRYRFQQMVGRGTRLSPGKTNCLVVDFDWKTDGYSRDLVTPVEFLAAEELNDLSETERAGAMAKAKKYFASGKMTAADAIEKARTSIKSKESIPVFMQGVHAEFEVEISDPLQVGREILGLEKKPYDTMKGTRYEPITENQAEFLKKRGMSRIENMTKFGASRMIDNIKKRERDGLATLTQVRLLRAKGIGADAARIMTFQEAVDALNQN